MTKSKGIFLPSDFKEKDNLIIAKRRARWKLPEGLIPSDFSPKENLIELEDTETGDRPWFRSIDLLRVDLRVGHEYIMYPDGVNSAYKMQFVHVESLWHGKHHYILPVFKKLEDCPTPEGPFSWKKGVCRECGCSMMAACNHPVHGTCSWADKDETLCSHCADITIKNDPDTIRPILK